MILWLSKSILLLTLIMIGAQPAKLFASETSTYNFKWLDPDKEVYVLQNRKFRKVKRVHLNLGFGITTSGSFSSASVLQGRAGYFITENWGIEFLYSVNNSETNDTFQAVRAQQAIPFVRLVTDYMGGLLLWSPFYAKINTFDQIVYFDWIFGLGFGTLNEENNRVQLNANDRSTPRYSSESHSTILWTTGMRFYLTEMFSMRLDFTGAHYQAKKALANTAEEVWYENFDLTLSTSLTF